MVRYVMNMAMKRKGIASVNYYDTVLYCFTNNWITKPFEKNHEIF